LSNIVDWKVYKIHFKQPIDKSLIFEVDLLNTSTRNTQLLECFGTLSREGFTQSSMTAFFHQQQATSKFSLAALLTTEGVITALKKELKKISPVIKVEDDFLKNTLLNDVIKRELVDSDEAKSAAEIIKKATKQATKPKIKPPPPPSA
jgi:acetolactate synthase small subunit